MHDLMIALESHAPWVVVVASLIHTVYVLMRILRKGSIKIRFEYPGSGPHVNKTNKPVPRIDAGTLE